MSEDTRRYRRHADDTVFRIEEQARSPNGAVTLRPAHYEGPAVHTTNDRLDVDFTRVDPVMPTVPTPAELIPKATDYAARIAEQTTAAIAQLRATQGKGASVRDETPVLNGVHNAMHAAGWSCRIEPNRDAKTGTLYVTAPASNPGWRR